MISLLDNFIAGCSKQADPIMGVGALTISRVGFADLVVSGVWSSVSFNNEAEPGGLMQEADAAVTALSHSDLDKSIIGRPATSDIGRFRVSNVDIGDVLTTIYLTSEPKIL